MSAQPTTGARTVIARRIVAAALGLTALTAPAWFSATAHSGHSPAKSVALPNCDVHWVPICDRL